MYFLDIKIHEILKILHQNIYSFQVIAIFVVIFYFGIKFQLLISSRN